MIATFFAVYAAMCEKIHDPVYAEISINADMAARTATCKADRVASGRGQPIVNAVTGQEHRVGIVLPNGFEYTRNEVGRGWSESTGAVDLSGIDMDLREPIEPVFRVGQMGLGYDEDQDMIVLVAQEVVIAEEEADPALIEPGVVRMWANRKQMRWLSIYALEIVKAGRADPRMNGRLTYYWS